MIINTEISETGFFVSITAMSAFIASASVSAASGRTGFVFISSILMWICYLSAHKFSEGEFVDGKPLKQDEINEGGKDKKMTPGNLAEYLGSFIGGSILVAGMGVGAHGVHELNLPVTFIGALMFTTGYTFAHLATTGEPL